MIEFESPMLNAAFWDRFVAEIWEREPCVLRGVMPAALATGAQLHHALAEAHRQGARADASMRLYRSTAMEHGQHDDAFPGAEDRDLRAWGRRLRRERDGEGFLLVLNSLQRFSRSIWYRARDFLAPMMRARDRVGISVDERVDVDAFVGWYDQTPEGVHKDAASNFMFVVHGPKRMQLWPAGAFAGPGERRDPFHACAHAAARTPGEVVEVGPSDVLYWPSSAWHVGRSSAGLTACINVPLYTRPDPHADVMAALAEMLAAGDGGPLESPAAGEPGAELDAQLARVRSILDAPRPGDDGLDVHARALDRRLRRRSTRGFERVPPPRTPALPTGPGRVVRRSRWPLLWSRTRGGELLCAGNGHSLVIPEHPALVALLRRLDAGGAVDELVAQTVGALGPAADEDSGAVIREILEAFAAWDVLTVV